MINPYSGELYHAWNFPDFFDDLTFNLSQHCNSTISDYLEMQTQSIV